MIDEHGLELLFDLWRVHHPLWVLSKTAYRAMSWNCLVGWAWETKHAWVQFRRLELFGVLVTR
jgi:hypothetical protein